MLRILKGAVCSKSSLVAENLFLRKQLAFYQEHEVKPRRLTDVARVRIGVLVSLVGLETGLDHRSARDPDSVAPPRVQALLALAVKARTTAPTAEHSQTDCTNGEGESNMGARPRRFGTIPEAGDLRLAPNGACPLVLRAGSVMPKDLLAALADVRPQSRAIARRL